MFPFITSSEGLSTLFILRGVRGSSIITGLIYERLLRFPNILIKIYIKQRSSLTSLYLYEIDLLRIKD